MPTEPKVRQRDTVYRRDHGRYQSLGYYGDVISDITFEADVVGKQITVSEGHPWRSYKRPPGNIGGPFRTSRTYFEDLRSDLKSSLYVVDWKSRNNSSRTTYTGPLYATPIHDGNGNMKRDIFPPTMESESSYLEGLGTTAIARVKPTNSVADLAVTLGETLREGIPSLIGHQVWKDRAKSVRNKYAAVGDEYLNYQFGWVPLVSDIKNVAKAATNTEKILAQYRRDAGRQVRRNYEFPSITDQVVDQQRYRAYALGIPGASLSTAGDPFDGEPVYVDFSRKLTQKRWFSGAFVYHLPITNSQYGNIARIAAEARKLYGLTIDPEVLWNLTPWSWAADWFANTGDIMSNVSDAITDGLVVKYGYMMEHTIVCDTYSVSGLHSGNGVALPPIETRLFTETKKRVEATPYGFGLNWDGFSTYQKSILAALGISKLRK